jgi:hypothetical protein
MRAIVMCPDGGGNPRSQQLGLCGEFVLVNDAAESVSSAKAVVVVVHRG